MTDTTTNEESKEVVIHPLYTEFKPLWTLQRDAFEGEPAIKKANFDYLPLPSGKQRKYDTQPKLRNTIIKLYNGYQLRADFPEILTEAVSSWTGLVFEDAGTVELPTAMKYLLQDAILTGGKIGAVMRTILQNQLIEGRIFALWTVDPANNNLKVVFYRAACIPDWRYHDGNGNLTAVVLDESGYAIQDYKWEWVKQYRLCAIDADGYYYTAVVDHTNFDFSKPPANAVYPELQGKRFSGSVPGVIFNSMSVGGDPEIPVTLKIAEACVKSYQLDADYKQALHITAQPTLVGINLKDASLEIGSSVVLQVDEAEKNADVKFLETTGVGFEALRKAIEDTKAEARKNIELIENAAEAGVALNTRLAVKTASLQSVALSLKEGMILLLRKAATWMSADEKQLKVIVNTDYRKDDLMTQDLVQLGTMVYQGLMTKQDVYYLLKKTGKTQFETYDEWLLHTESIGFDFEAPPTDNTDTGGDENGTDSE